MLAHVECRPIRVLIADDHEMVRAGMARLLDASTGIEVVGMAGDGEEAIALAADRVPDVVLMDLEMPVVDGVEAIQRITRAEGAPRVIVLTSFSDRDRITEALDSGAVGYLLKHGEPEDVVAGIRAAADGESPLAPRVALTLVRERRNGGRLETLTDREREVLALVGAGAANGQIAARLGIRPKTVKRHLTNAFRHIGADDRAQAGLWARRHGLVDDGPLDGSLSGRAVSAD